MFGRSHIYAFMALQLIVCILVPIAVENVTDMDAMLKLLVDLCHA
jgi:hypothetical protein